MTDTKIAGATLDVARPRAAELEEALEQYSVEIAKVLSKNIPLERFMRVLATAISENPDLGRADRRTLFNACIKCANDGLYPDGREAALVTFNTEVKRGGQKVWIQAVQYMPMMAGIRKRMRNTGEVRSATAETVHQNDHFMWRKGDDPRIEHEPPPLGQDRGPAIGYYAIIKLANGEVLRDVMSKAEVERRRQTFSKAPAAPSWMKSFDEMGMKTVLRHLAKAAPSGSEFDRLLGRMDEAEISDDPHYAVTAPPRPQRDDFYKIENTDPEDEPAPVDETIQTWTVHLVEGEVRDFVDLHEAREALEEAFRLAPNREALRALWIDNSELIRTLPPPLPAEVEAVAQERAKEFDTEPQILPLAKAGGSPPTPEAASASEDTPPTESAITEAPAGPAYDVTVPLEGQKATDWFNPAKKRLEQMKRDQRPPVDYTRYRHANREALQLVRKEMPNFAGGLEKLIAAGEQSPAG